MQAAIAAAKNGDHANALRLYDELFAQAAKQHLTHPELFVTYANRAASHLAVGQHAEALQVMTVIVYCRHLLSQQSTAHEPLQKVQAGYTAHSFSCLIPTVHIVHVKSSAVLVAYAVLQPTA